MKTLKKTGKWILFFLALPALYLIVSLLLTSVTIDRKMPNGVSDKSIFLSTNGVHLNIIIPKHNIDALLLSGIKHEKPDSYLSFGWGEEHFYLNTPTWKDVTFVNAFRALFLKSSTLIHVTRYTSKHPDWIEIKINETELNQLNSYILKSFETGEHGMKIRLGHQGYSLTDDFYKAKGNYSCFKTCNSWVNRGFKESGLKSCLWTPFDFGLLDKYD